MYIRAILLLLLINTSVQAQHVDEIIRQDSYISYFSIDFKAPLYVVYRLHKGGGNCSQDTTKFTNDTKYPTATYRDYKHTGFKPRQLANALDFAYDCDLAKKTYRFYNTVPIADELFRGPWKTWSNIARQESQTEDLRIVSGAIYSRMPNTIGDGVPVPKYCYKIVYSFTRHRYLHILLFTNNAAATVRESTIGEIEKLAGYRLRYE